MHSVPIDGLFQWRTERRRPIFEERLRGVRSATRLRDRGALSLRRDSLGWWDTAAARTRLPPSSSSGWRLSGLGPGAAHEAGARHQHGHPCREPHRRRVGRAVAGPHERSGREHRTSDFLPSADPGRSRHLLGEPHRAWLSLLHATEVPLVHRATQDPTVASVSSRAWSTGTGKPSSCSEPARRRAPHARR